MPMREADRGSVPIRVPRELLPLLDRVKARLEARTGGRFSRGAAARVVAEAWLRGEGGGKR